MISRGRVERNPSDPAVGVGYVRVSTEDQHLGPQAQREAIERWARANDVRVVAWHEDLGVSGGAPVEDRPGLLNALDSLATHGAGVLLVAKRDRLARDVMIAAVIERLTERAMATIVSADGTGNGSGPEAALMRAIIDAFAAYERALIRTRTKSALAIKKSRGERVSGHAPMGYEFGVDGRLVELAAEKAIVARVREMHAAGISLNAIARTFNAEGVPCRGARWYPATIQRIVRAAVVRP